MKGKDTQTFLDNEMKSVTNFLQFLITQPNLLTRMVDEEREKIMLINLLRIRCGKLWMDSMVKELELKCSKESIKSINELFKIIEITKK